VTDLGNTARSQALNSLDASGTPANLIGFVALHVGDPSTTGANENANAGSYARQACTWNASSGGSAKTNSTALTFATLGTVAVTWLAGWTVVTYAGGSMGIGAQLGASVTAASITVASGAISLAAS
jgi:hypothetical protein